MALHASMDNNRFTLALRIPRVGIRSDLRWDGVTLIVAVRMKGKIYCLNIDTVRRRESDIIELAMTFMLNAEDLIDAMNRRQFPSLIIGVETLRTHGLLHQTITDVRLGGAQPEGLRASGRKIRQDGRGLTTCLPRSSGEGTGTEHGHGTDEGECAPPPRSQQTLQRGDGQQRCLRLSRGDAHKEI